MNETRYVIIYEGDVHPTGNVALPLDAAVDTAKRLARKENRRVNLFKLVQSHTFAKTICDTCEQFTVAVKTYPTPQLELPL